MHHTTPCRLGSTTILNRPLRTLTLTLAASLCMTATASVFAASNQSLAAAAIRAFDRNHNQRLDTSEYRSLRIRMRDVFDGDSVSSSVIRQASPEFQAIYAAADRDRSVSLSSSESREAAAVLSALSRTQDRRVGGRSSRSRASNSFRPSNANSSSLAGLSRRSGPVLSTRGTPGTFGAGQVSPFSRPTVRSNAGHDLQDDLRAAQQRFEAMRARMELEAELRRRGILLPDDQQPRQSQASRGNDHDDSLSPGGPADGDDRSNSASTGSDRDGRSGSGSGTRSDHDGDSDGDDRPVAPGGSSSSGTGNSGSDGPDDSSGSGRSGHHEGHEERGEGHHEGNHEEHDDDHDGDD